MANNKYRNLVQDLLDNGRDVLSLPIVLIYHEVFGADYLAQVKQAIKPSQFSHIPKQAHRNPQTFAANLDTYSVFQLAKESSGKTKQRIVDKYGSYLLDLVEKLHSQRNQRAHESSQTSATLYDAIEVAEVTLELLDLVNRHDLKEKVLAIKADLDNDADQQITQTVSSSIHKIHEVIDKLTTQQYMVIKELHGKRKVAISGCAGSGKTLIAVEKAIRLDKAGFKTLILCRNPRLASYIRKLAENSDIQVQDFIAWVATMVGNHVLTNNWTPYANLSDDTLDKALEYLEDEDNQFDAVIIDEGQDFQDEWWLVVESALKEPKSGSILYIFHDNNQQLTPKNLKYPVEVSEHTLSQNCRNAGKIFSFVAQYHQDKLAPNPELDHKGELFFFKLHDFKRSEMQHQVSRAFLRLAKFVGQEQIVVITTEEQPHVLLGLQMPFSTDWDWQKVINNYFHGIVPNPGKINMTMDFANLDYVLARQKIGEITEPKTWFPTKEQEELVTRIAELAYEHLDKLPPKQVKTFQWELYNRRERSSFRPDDRKYLEYFCKSEWVKDIKNRYDFEIGRNIPIYTPEEYKGLEANGVILLVHQPMQNSWHSSIYVGASRAKYCLCVVSDSISNSESG
jgi:hypothetical protein